MKNLSVIIPSFRSEKLVEILIRSFEKFKPETLVIQYIVVENSEDTSYRDRILKLPNVTWLQNEGALSIFDVGNGSDANASGVEMALEHVSTEYVFICHCDTCVTSSSFFEEMTRKVDEGYKLIGTSVDPSRIKAIHISGLLADTSLAKSVSYFPERYNEKVIHDVGDLLTKKCREEQIPHFKFKNTFNNPWLNPVVNEPFKDFNVDRCLDSNGKVMFMHLGRGIEKQFGCYDKPNRVYFPQWVWFCENIIR
jgi:molybdopterin-guanine dinucleotide biosynthesis protein A